MRVNLKFVQTLAKYEKAGRDVKVIYGSEIRYDVLPRSSQPVAESTEGEVLTESSAMVFIQRLADEKGLSLKHIFRDIHAKFINQKAEEALQNAEEGQKKGRKRTSRPHDHGRIRQSSACQQSRCPKSKSSRSCERVQCRGPGEYV
ncbi:leucine-rich repeat-containing protein 74A [Caerostris extrusa]|uniref:Leucine-rich repeat-containing protein 74A n=1 Tax=Caerostris extrusa TaxID=172846 RepID=A0AAV4P713_CAEEX|nr:leucine-rich repeat-containing protein 74A [Caerostris extrusa]